MPPEFDSADGPRSSAFENIQKALKEAGATHEAEPNGDGKEKNIRRKVGRADQVYNKEKRKTEYFKSSERKSRKGRFTKYVIFVRTVFSAKGVPDHVEIDIKGNLLHKALLDINAASQGLVFSKQSETITKEAFYHSKDQLCALIDKENAASEPDEDLLFELTAGKEFIVEEFGSEINSLKVLTAKQAITFRLLWMLFPPNTLSVGQDELGQTFAVIVRSTTYYEDNYDVWHFVLTADHLDHDGKDIVMRTGMSIDIVDFGDERAFTALQALPLELHPNREFIKHSRLDAFTQVARFHGRRLVEYNGHGLREIERQEEIEIVKFNSHGRVMLDPTSLARTQPETKLRPNTFAMIKPCDLTDELRMTMSPKLYGFSLGDKIWGAFALSNLTEVEFDPGIFHSLVLRQERKDIIRDLVTAHKSTIHTFDDFVRDKGKGLVGLLAGPPGVGKTMTAEAIAEVTERPLYNISSGELGTESESIHDKLKVILELAELWHAVVLLDEADVFLCKRSETDLKRNAITSIFLRELEYYQGILILTTNRLNSFDSAFQSRIHFCIEYEGLEAEGRKQIWKDYLSRAAETAAVVVDIDDAGYTHLGGLELNGRQIKNIMSVTQSVATTRKKPITVNSIERSIELCQSFTIGKQELL